MFVSASLLVTFLTLTAALQLALWRVRFLADCTQQDSQCLSDVRLWVYEHLLQSFVQVDLNTLKLQVPPISCKFIEYPIHRDTNEPSDEFEGLAKHHSEQRCRPYQLPLPRQTHYFRAC